MNLPSLSKMRRLVTDSRQVKRGDTFVAYVGETQDGRRYIPQAIANGAHFVLWEKKGFQWKRAWQVENAGIANLRANAGILASAVYDHPSTRLWMVGVTGTNGKTSCSQWIAQALNNAGISTAVIGTLGYGVVGKKLKPLANTTPDAVWLQAQLAGDVKKNVRAVSMEVSSIGLDQDRVAGIQFDVALFTNLTRDHLDYHRTLARYRAAKAKLFATPSLKYAVVNIDDGFGATLARDIQRPGLKVVSYGFDRKAKIRARNLIADTNGIRFDVETPWGKTRIASPVLGRFNAYNLLGTFAVLLASGFSVRKAGIALKEVAPPAGRMQKIGGGKKPLVVVDYAHTPDALEQVLRTLRELLQNTDGKLICVFGCGGDRDKGKRPLMGAVATKLADRVVVTSDNPRSEKPQAIIQDILAGIKNIHEALAVSVDRKKAIRHAIKQATRGDIVLIAGKGHETYQEINGVRKPFDDAAIAKSMLKEAA